MMLVKMRSLYLLTMCSTVFYVAVSADSCPPAEEGTSYNMTCRHSGKFLWERFSEFEWSIVNINKNNSKTHVAMCSHRHCRSRTNGIAIAFDQNNTTNILTISNVSRVTPFNAETKWQCNQKFICEPLQVYVKPKNVSCYILPRDSYSDSVAMTCTTERIYPEAICEAYTSTDSIQFQEISILNVSHTALNETPIYYRSECTLLLNNSFFHNGHIFIKVKMYPNVRKGSLYGETYLTILNIHTESPDFSSLTSPYLVTGLSVALAVTGCATLVLGILVMWCRRKPTILVPHLENNDTKEPSKPVFTGYNTMNMSELDNDDTNDNYEEVVNPCQTSFSREQYDYENEQDDKGENIYGNI